MSKVRETLQSLVDRRARTPTAGSRTPASPYIPTPPPRVAPTPTPPVAARRPSAQADRTQRVPDPPTPPIGQRIAAASAGKGMLIAGAIVAFLVIAGLVAALTGLRRDDPSPEDPRVTPPPTTTPYVPQTLAPYTPPPVAPLGVRTPAPAPSPVPSPIVSPTVRASATPTAAPVTLGPPTPLPPAARPTPSPAGPPAPMVVRPELIEPSPEPSPEVEGPVERLPPSPGPAADLTGRWQLSNRIVSTSYDAYRGLNLGYSLTLRQEGARVTGSGVKVTENGSPAGQRTPISVSCRIEGSSVVLTFTEQGSSRTSGGTFRWQLSADGSRLAGSFWSDVANANGPSSARRVD